MKSFGGDSATCCDRLLGAFHSTKISGNSGANRMEQTFSGNSFRKFQFTSRGCPFFWKFGNSGNFLFHLSFLPGMSRPQFLWLWRATRWRRVFRVDTFTGCKMICHSSSLFLIAPRKREDLISWKIVDWSFRISCGSVRPVCILSREKTEFVSLILSQISTKSWIWMRIKLLYMRHLTA